MKSGRLAGWQWLWVVFTMIWVVLAASLKVPEFTDEQPVYLWAGSEIDATLRKFDQSVPSASAQTGGIRRTDSGSRYKYVDLSGLSTSPVKDYVDYVLSDRGENMIRRLCVDRPGCIDAARMLSPEFERIRAELTRQLAETKAQQKQLLKSGLRLVLIPPIGALLFGIAISRIVARIRHRTR